MLSLKMSSGCNGVSQKLARNGVQDYNPPSNPKRKKYDFQSRMVSRWYILGSS